MYRPNMPTYVWIRIKLVTAEVLTENETISGRMPRSYDGNQ